MWCLPSMPAHQEGGPCHDPLQLVVGPRCSWGTVPLILMQTSTTGLRSCAVSLSLFSAQKPRGVTAARVCSSGLWPVPHVQETCCKGLTTAPFIRGISAVFLAIAFGVFFPHALGVTASEHVSRAAPWGQQGLSHSCLLPPSQQPSPGFPRDNHCGVLIALLPGSARVPSGWSQERSCSSC